MNLCDINEIKNLLGQHGFHFSKSMGQNFLIESWVPRDIAASSGAGSGIGVLEIGAGIGCLTAELAKLADKVVSVELDRALLPILKQTLAPFENTTVISGDILKTDLPALVQEQFAGKQVIVCANLPYNITTPVLSALIEANCFASITVMIQREVAQRICAAPASREYGAFSVYCQYHTKPELLFDVPPTCFVPAPKVTSTVLRLEPKAPPQEVDDKAQFFRVVKAAFAQRRKTLLNALSATFSPPLSKQQIADAIKQCGLSADIRGERLSIAEFAALSKQLRRQTQEIL